MTATRTQSATQTQFTPAPAIRMPAEATFAGDIGRGAQKARATFVQEWLVLHGHSVQIDGGYGPATETAVRAFQARQGIAASGVVDRATFDALVAPMARALAPIARAPGDTLGSMVVKYAQQHLAEHPREAGGDNMGPWVRLYMDGNQGPAWRWCAGFATMALAQACNAAGELMPVRRTFSCDVLAMNAERNGILLREPSAAKRSRVTPGSLFLVRRTDTDWVHVGIVLDAMAEAFGTIEGNTNDSGDANGFEVCQRTRGYGKKDFVLIP